MRAVIFRRSEVENGSLLLNVFTETGKTKKLKIPGILKSKTRNAFFLAPATLWDFTISGNDKEIVTPKEFSLIHSPYDFNTGYQALVCIGEILKPLTYLRPDLEITPLFDDLSDILFRWKCGDKTTENFLINEFYLKFLHRMGLLHHSTLCVHCGNALTDHDSYHLFSGSICGSCLRQQEYRENELIPNKWMSNHINNTPGYAREEECSFRNKILDFLNASI